MIGLVVSVKMNKTAVVKVTSRKTHPLYRKSYIWQKKYLADDPIGVKEGDVVEIEKIRPISKKKHWQVVSVTGHRIEEIIEEQLKEEAQEAIEEAVPAGRQVMPEDKEEEPADKSQQTTADENAQKTNKKKKKGKSDS